LPRDRLYASNAERQAAYRARLGDRRRLAGTDAAVSRLQQLEKAVTDAQRAKDVADARAERAQQRSQAAEAALHGARRRLDALEATVADLTRQLAAARPQPTQLPNTVDGPNRAARRRADREQRRRH
jgi:DNA repair exonuclease SbcCD ATPase subunit